jgi:Mrp family chromosome partitioning ATPase
MSVNTNANMSVLDQIDAAFLARWQAGVPLSAPPVVEEPPPMQPQAPPIDELPGRPSAPDATSITDRLLAAAWPEWNGLAAHVEAARLRGRRVFAIAGGEPREGRTTLVECLATTLRTRGRDVHCTTPTAVTSVTAPAAGPAHDKRIVLVDAGIWFPGGPIRRQWLAVCTVGCDAAILVRRADRAPAVARRAALEAFGVEVLGEVLTFTDTDSLTATEASA